MVTVAVLAVEAVFAVADIVKLPLPEPLVREGVSQLWLELIVQLVLDVILKFELVVAACVGPHVERSIVKSDSKKKL